MIHLTEFEFENLFYKIEEDDPELDMFYEQRGYAQAIYERCQPNDLKTLCEFVEGSQILEYVDEELESYNEKIDQLSDGEGLYEEGGDDYIALCESIFPSGDYFYFDYSRSHCSLLFGAEKNSQDIYSIYYCILDWSKYAHLPRPIVRNGLKSEVRHFSDFSTEDFSAFLKLIEKPRNISFLLDRIGFVNTDFSIREFPD
jgi:hypothetical protein